MNSAVDGPLRIYDPESVGKDGYPPEWHKVSNEIPGIKHLVREAAGHRCVRCGHPYRNGEHGRGEWSPCDRECHHPGPLRVIDGDGVYHDEEDVAAWQSQGAIVEAKWRILTVHHLDGNKWNCSWWNLASLCQRCHLTIQGKVRMSQVYPLEHSRWFKPYAAGWYAFSYLGQELSRDEVMERLDELLGLELQVAT